MRNIRALTVAATAVGALAVAGCGIGAQGEDSPDDVITLKWAYVHQPGSRVDVGINNVAKAVEEQTDGRVKFELFPAGQLGSDIEAAEQLVDGTVDLVSSGLPYQQAPELQVLIAPYVFEDTAGAVRALNSDVAREQLLDPVREKTGTDVLGLWYFGDYYFFSNKKFSDPASMKGVKVRTPEQQNTIDAVKALGGTPVAIAYPETYTALQTGTADAVFGPIPPNFDMNFDEVTDYVIPYGTKIFVPTGYNADNLDELSDADFQVLKDAMETEGEALESDLLVAEEEGLATARETMTYVDADVDAFQRAIVDNFLPKYESIYGEGLYAALQSEAAATTP